MNWVKVYTAENQIRAELILGMLEQHQIKGILLDKKDPMNLFGKAEIYCTKEEAIKATNLIKNEQLGE